MPTLGWHNVNLVFIIDAQERTASAGDMLHVPRGVRHGATMLDEEVVLIDIFSPVRENFLAAGRDALP